MSKFSDLTPWEHRSQFVLLELYSQMDAVRKYTEGWSIEEVVCWLQLYGEIFTLWGHSSILNHKRFRFRSHAVPGRSWDYIFDSENKIAKIY